LFFFLSLLTTGERSIFFFSPVLAWTLNKYKRQREFRPGPDPFFSLHRTSLMWCSLLLLCFRERSARTTHQGVVPGSSPLFFFPSLCRRILISLPFFPLLRTGYQQDTMESNCLLLSPSSTECTDNPLFSLSTHGVSFVAR